MMDKAEADRRKLQEELARQQAEVQRELAASQVRECSVQLARPFTSMQWCTCTVVCKCSRCCVHGKTEYICKTVCLCGWMSLYLIGILDLCSCNMLDQG